MGRPLPYRGLSIRRPVATETRNRGTAKGFTLKGNSPIGEISARAQNPQACSDCLQICDDGIDLGDCLDRSRNVTSAVDRSPFRHPGEFTQYGDRNGNDGCLKTQCPGHRSLPGIIKYDHTQQDICIGSDLHSSSALLIAQTS